MTVSCDRHGVTQPLCVIRNPSLWFRIDCHIFTVSGIHWVQRDTATTQTKVRHHPWVGAVRNWLLQQSDHFRRNNALQGRLQRGLIALRAYLYVLAHIQDSGATGWTVTTGCSITRFHGYGPRFTKTRSRSCNAVPIARPGFLLRLVRHEPHPLLDR
jgi:hypothetical protein